MLTGPSVTLRALTADDADLLYRIHADLDTWEQRTPEPPRPVTRAAYQARFDARLSDPDVEFVISAAGDGVGRIGLFGEDTFARHAEVGIALLPEARGRGYGTEALRLVCEFAFTRRNVRRLHLSVITSNAAAIRAYRKVGFVEEGRRREHAWVRGRYEDEVAMGLLRSEFRS